MQKDYYVTKIYDLKNNNTIPNSEQVKHNKTCADKRLNLTKKTINQTQQPESDLHSNNIFFPNISQF